MKPARRKELRYEADQKEAIDRAIRHEYLKTTPIELLIGELHNDVLEEILLRLVETHKIY
jgi:hypothetical protein